MLSGSVTQDSMEVDGRMSDSIEASMLTQEQVLGVEGGGGSSGSFAESSFLEQSDEDYDIRALEALGMIRTERNAPTDEIYDDVSVAANVDGTGGGGWDTGYSYMTFTCGNGLQY